MSTRFVTPRYFLNRALGIGFTLPGKTLDSPANQQIGSQNSLFPFIITSAGSSRRTADLQA